MPDIESFLLPVVSSIREAIKCIDHNRRGIALLIDTNQRLVGTITDGDLRRGVLAGCELNGPVTTLLHGKPAQYAQVTTAPHGTAPEEMASLMRKASIRHLPILDADGHIVDLAMLDDPDAEPHLPLEAVIMAGGFGKRLAPLTHTLPKPMLPVGDRPLLELTIERLRKSGIHRVNVTTHYLSEKIADHFGDGKDFGIDLNYVTEEESFGTAGALSLMDKPDQPLLVINGDILTDVDFRAMLEFHRQHKAEATIGVRQYDLQVPYGVVDCEGAEVTELREKPTLNFLVNAGIYLLEPSVHESIPRGRHFDMTDLVRHLMIKSRRVVSFPVLEYWLDIGQLKDYERAQIDHRNGRLVG